LLELLQVRPGSQKFTFGYILKTGSISCHPTHSIKLLKDFTKFNITESKRSLIIENAKTNNNCIITDDNLKYTMIAENATK